MERVGLLSLSVAFVTVVLFLVSSLEIEEKVKIDSLLILFCHAIKKKQ